jgi:tetratricopeptide (TPR) repeat protein
LLDEQFFGDSQFHSYLKDNFVLFHAEGVEGKGLAQFEAYMVRGTPTVLFMTPEGEEIDRLMGFGGSGTEYLERIKSLLASETTLLALKKAYEADPGDFQVVGELLRKYVSRRDIDSGQTYLALLLSNPEKAKAAMLPADDNLEQPVPVYEYASYVLSATSLEGIETFATDFSESILLDQALTNLTRFLLGDDTNEEAYGIYSKLKRQFPRSEALHASFLRYAERSDKHFDEAVACGDFLCSNPENKDNITYHRTFCSLLVNNDRLDKALTVFGPEYAALHWDDARFLNSYGWIWALKAENLESAEAAAKRAIELDENDSTWDTLSMIYWKQGKLESAIDAEERALELAGGTNKGYEDQIKAITEELTSQGS